MVLHGAKYSTATLATHVSSAERTARMTHSSKSPMKVSLDAQSGARAGDEKLEGSQPASTASKSDQWGSGSSELRGRGGGGGEEQASREEG